MKTLVYSINAVPNLLYWVLGKLHVPKDVQDTIVHFAIVFTTAFVSQIIGSAIGTFNWPTVYALLASGAAAGVSAVVHYALSLVPSVQTKAACKKAKAKAKKVAASKK